MKNKTTKVLFVSFFLFSFFYILLFVLIHFSFIKKYQYNNNLLLSKIFSVIQEQYPYLEEEEIIEIINTKDLKESSSFLFPYGIDIQKDSMSLSHKKILRNMLLAFFLLFFLYFICLFFLLFLSRRRENKKIKEITHYIKEINRGNYALDILSNSEDDLSILKNEIYKTTITLNEQALLLKKEKETLKDSLSDISHQLKTPLTSINLMIERLRGGEEMTKDEREKLLMDIHRKISHINFLVHSLLKLSKLDANAVPFHDKYYKIEDILYEVKDNLSILCDLKDIEIHIKGEPSYTLFCDYKWQVEALTNIVKNCLEYSLFHSNILITYETNEVFTKIVITDYGSGMTTKECSHIFDRFYKGTNSSLESVGIGLSLAKSIIEKENGHIMVKPTLGKGTTFTIKYLK